MAEPTWTPSMVEERFVEAASVLRRLPEPKIQGYFSTWPAIRPEPSDLVGREPELLLARPSPASISRMEETLTWTLGLEPIEARVIWLRAFGEPWKAVCWKVGLQRSAAHQHWLYALSVVALRLNRRKINRKASRQKVIDLARAAKP